MPLQLLLYNNMLLLLLLQTESPAQTQFYCIVNTVVSLLGACLSAFACSAAFEGKLDMVHIQNATLAGGVAVGSAANLKIAPGGNQDVIPCVLLA
jgi:ammonia channel protein AmtB